MYDRLSHSSAARTIFSVLFWGIITELVIVALGLATDRRLPALLHLGLLYLGSYLPLALDLARQYALGKRSG